MAKSRRSLEKLAARTLAALGKRIRLRLFRLLTRAGRDGLTVGQAQQHLGIPESTLAHHLSTLAQAGVVVQERRGREVVCTADFVAMNGLRAYLTEQCRAGVHLEAEADAA